MGKYKCSKCGLIYDNRKDAQNCCQSVNIKGRAKK